MPGLCVTKQIWLTFISTGPSYPVGNYAMMVALDSDLVNKKYRGLRLVATSGLE